MGREVGDGLGPGVVAELPGVVAEVAGEGAPAARVGEAAAEDAVGARHVRRVPEDGADVGLGPVPGRKPTMPTAMSRGREDLADEVARLPASPCCGRRGDLHAPRPTASRGSRPCAIVMRVERIGRRRREPLGVQPGADGRVAQALEGRLDPAFLDPAAAGRPCPGSCCRPGRDRCRRSGRGPAPGPGRSGGARGRPARCSARRGRRRPRPGRSRRPRACRSAAFGP